MANTIVILDAGSGIRHLGESGLLDKYDTIHILANTPPHGPHTRTWGFSRHFSRKAGKIKMWGPSGPTTLVKRLNRYLSPPLFPVRIRDFLCDLTMEDMSMKSLQVGCIDDQWENIFVIQDRH